MTTPLARADVPSAKPDCECGEPASAHWLTLNGRAECTLFGRGCACTAYRSPSLASRLEHLATALGTARMALIGILDLDELSDQELAAALYWHGHDDPRGN